MIRFATVDDIPRIVEMGQRLHDETSYAHVTYAPERVAKTAETMIEAGFCIVAVKDDRVVGAMMGDVFVPWYTTDKMGIDYTFYIEPEHRNGLMAVKMIKMFEAWCVELGATQIRPGVGTGDPGVERLYLALGYQPMGHWFCKNC